jgi:hypothetical protein
MTNAMQPFHLLEENRVLKEQLEGQRLRFTDDQRIRLAVKAKVQILIFGKTKLNKLRRSQ